jgi:hypothetical protein
MFQACSKGTLDSPYFLEAHGYKKRLVGNITPPDNKGVKRVLEGFCNSVGVVLA